MTPKRKAYLNKCSQEEIWLRLKIRESKDRLFAAKIYRNPESNFCSMREGKKRVRFAKFMLKTYQNALARLKGMDRVVVVGDDEPFANTLTGAEYWICKCGTGIYVTDNYCSNCGKRILWEKVK